MKNSPCSKLAKLKLKTPQKVLDYFEELKTNFRYEECLKKYAHYIQIYREKLIMRTWAVRIRKNGLMEYSEVVRRGEDLIPVFCNCDYGYLSGWVCDYGYDWDPYAAYIGHSKDIGWMFGKYINADEISKRFDPHHTYTYDTGLEFFEYIFRLIEEPAIEYLIKNGYAPLIKSINMLNKNARSIDKILKVDHKWADYLKGKSRNYLIACRKYKTIEEVEEYVRMMSSTNSRPLLKYVKNHMNKYIEYCRQQSTGYYYINESLYKDYLDMASKLGYPLEETRYLFPDNIQAAHDKVMNETQVQKGKLFQKQFEEQFRKLTRFTYETDQLLIRPCQSNSELIKESETLHHCVRTYAERYAKGLTGIFFIRKLTDPETPYVTVELKGKTVIQVRADHNAAPEMLVKQFVEQWKAVYKLA